MAYQLKPPPCRHGAGWLAGVGILVILVGCAGIPGVPAWGSRPACEIVNGRRWCPLPDLRTPPAIYHDQRAHVHGYPAP